MDVLRAVVVGLFGTIGCLLVFRAKIRPDMILITFVAMLFVQTIVASALIAGLELRKGMSLPEKEKVDKKAKTFNRNVYLLLGLGLFIDFLRLLVIDRVDVIYALFSPQGILYTAVGLFLIGIGILILKKADTK